MQFRTVLALTALASIAAGCASAPPKPPPAPTISADQKMSWILRMEDQRILKVPEPPPPPVVAPPPKQRRNVPPPPPPVVTPDLTKLVTDADARIRRRAALAIGRVGLADGGAALQPLLTDADAEVRQMAAFALGLLADKTAVTALTIALQDPDARVRGRAAEALGLIGDTTSASAVGQMVSGYIKQGAIATIGPDDEQFPKSPEADAVRLGVFALVRLRSYEALASAVQDQSGRVSVWWPVAFAFQRINDRRAVPVLRELARTPGRYTRSFAARGLGAQRDTESAAVLTAMLEQAGADVAVAVPALRALAQIGHADPIIAILNAEKADPNLRLEAVTALGTIKSQAALQRIQDYITDDWPTLRAAA